MPGFGFGVRAGTTSCPELLIEVQHYEDQIPVNFKISSSFGTPTIDFPDGTRLFTHTYSTDPKDGKQYILQVSKMAQAVVKKFPYDEDDDDE